MRTVTVYLAVDGRQFQDADACKQHDARLFEAWLRDNPRFNEFLKANKDDARHRGTFYQFWEWGYGKPVDGSKP